MPAVRVGTAGWTIARAHAHEVPEPGSHLERYARTFSCAEINSTFYRPSRQSTWLRWAGSVPDGFRFSVKAPKAVTHEAALELTADCVNSLGMFLEQVALLGPKLGPLLFQLPPKQAFDAGRTSRFFEHLRHSYDGAVVLEPRHATVFADADSLLAPVEVARVAADPAPVPEAAVPGGSPSLLYYRLHGSPRKYYSAYDQHFFAGLASNLRRRDAESWVIFDNTASGAALGNALSLLSALRDT